MIRTHSDVVNLWPSAAELARDLAIGEVRVRAWRNRNSIPPEMWLEVVDAAQKRGLDVTLERLAEIARDNPPVYGKRRAA